MGCQGAGGPVAGLAASGAERARRQPNHCDERGERGDLEEIAQGERNMPSHATLPKNAID